MYAVYHGPTGIKRIAQRVHEFTKDLAAGLAALGWRRTNEHYFDTLTLHTGAATQAIFGAAKAGGMNLRRVDEAHVGISLDETATATDVEALLKVFAQNRQASGYEALDADEAPGYPA